ncbi:MAG TPA: cell division protein FtsA [Edaphocola sp.]|nr:cell division protein FtsA [Edaphocola sp.]
MKHNFDFNREQSTQHNMNQTQEQPIIVGLDIGTTKVVAIAGRKNEYGKLEILGLGQAESLGVTHGVVLNIDQCILSIKQAIEKCLYSNPNLEIKDVYVGIAGQHIRSHQTRGDRVRSLTENEITKEEIELLIRDQSKTYIPAGDQIIDIIPQDYIVDNIPNVMNPVGMSGVKIGANFHIITGDRHAIRNIKRCVDRSGLNTRDLVLQPLASAAAVMNEQDMEAGVCIVDIGGGTTDMAVFCDNMLRHTAVIPYAGTNITEDIRLGLGVLRSQAEAMKNQFGMALAEEANANAYITIPGLRGMQPKEISVKNLAHIIQARTKEILEHVLYHLKQLNLHHRLHGGIILTGGGSQLKHIIQLTEYVSGMGARIGYPVEHLAGGYAEELQHPKYATCIGLILRGYSDFEKGKLDLDESNSLVENAAEPLTATFIKVEAPAEPAREADLFDQLEDMTERPQKIKGVKESANRSRMIERVFSSIKTEFMKLFEEPGDTKI